MKKNFMAGLAILLPIAITYWLVMFFTRLFTKPFLGFANRLFTDFGWHGSPELLVFFSQILILATLFLVVIAVGFIGRLFLVEALLSFGDRFVHKIPLVNKLYKAIQDVVHSVFHNENPSFSKVVLVPFPYEGSYSVGFITRETMMEPSLDKKDLVSVFVAGTPNPSMGFMLTFKKQDLIPLEMETSEAIKFIVSCGVITPKK
jgi:uncharacterized membrane protein